MHQLMANAARTYAEVDPVSRRQLNQVFFKKLLISPSRVEGAELTDEFGLVLADDLAERLEAMGRQKSKPPFRGGSNFDLLVEAPRFELGSADAVRGCLQA